jgi:E3 ubiquitin-protein ligase SHPRH
VIIPNEIERQPEYEVLHKELSDERKELLKQFQGRALKSVLFDMNAAAARIYNENDPEKIILRKASQELRQLITSQGW